MAGAEALRQSCPPCAGGWWLVGDEEGKRGRESGGKEDGGMGQDETELGGCEKDFGMYSE